MERAARRLRLPVLIKSPSEMLNKTAPVALSVTATRATAPPVTPSISATPPRRERSGEEGAEKRSELSADWGSAEGKPNETAS